MKKVISLISSLALVISLSSCAIKETPIINGVEYKYNDQFYADTVDQLLTYIDDGDKDGVKSLLCNGLKNSDGIDADIQALIDGFEGDIITNPPYSTGLEFVQRALESVRPGGKVAMFLKVQFLEGQKRGAFFKDTPPPYSLHISFPFGLL